MSYEIERSEEIEQSVQRIAKEQIRKAIRDVDDVDLVLVDTVHEVRKRCKKIRGLIRLARPGFEDIYSTENASFRNSARALSDVRDAASLLECLEALLERYKASLDRERFEPMHTALAARLRDVESAEDVRDHLSEIRSAMKAAKKRVRHWQLDSTGFSPVAGGFEETYRRARSALRKAYDTSGEGDFHEWRKRVKYHRYHCRLLRPMWEPLLGARREELKRLSDYLGDDHDLAVLRQTLQAEQERFADLPMVTDLLALIDARQAELKAWARPLGERLFAEKPKQLVSRLKAIRRAWRSEATLDGVLGKRTAEVYS